MAVASLIIAILSLLFGAFTYFRHDRKLKEQQRIINEYQIAKLQKESTELLKAELRASLTKVASVGSCVGMYSGTLVIKNYGKGTARRVSIKGRINLPWLTNEDFVPGEQKEYPVEWNFGHGNTDVQLSWTDDSGERQERKCSLLP